MTSSPSARPVGERAGVDRDRFVDLVRAVSITVVVFGHWTMAAITPDPASGVRIGNVLEVSPGLHPLTWIGQVMPLFFFAAGFTNALALRSRSRTTRAFLAGRVERVTRPVIVFAAIWLAASAVLPVLGVDPYLVRTAAQNSAMVLWFLAVYLVLALLAPLQVTLHRRHPWLVLLLAPPLAAVLDQTQGTGWAGLGFLNYVVVFAFFQQVGLIYADGRLLSVPRIACPMVALGAVSVLVLLTGLGPYPVSMIGLPGQPMSNMLPPSVCVIAVGILQVALAMTLRPILSRWLQRAWLWVPVAVVNRSIMTIFLWHLTAMVMLTGAALAADLPWPDPGTGTWWAQKVVWLLLATVLTALLVWALSSVEWMPSRAAQRPGLLAGVGAGAVAAGMTMLASAGFVEPFTSGGVSLAGLTFAPAPGFALICLGYLLCRWPVTRAGQLPGTKTTE